jgi:hypothetical protein
VKRKGEKKEGKFLAYKITGESFHKYVHYLQVTSRHSGRVEKMSLKSMSSK